MKFPYNQVLAFLTFLLTLSLNGLAQKTTLSGAIVIDKTEVMSYTITYQLSDNNTLTGHSISDLNGEEETKSQITGSYNAKAQTMNFEEKKILHTKSKSPIDEFCLMKVQGKFEKKGGKTVFTGEFSAFNQDDDILCASGTLILLTEKDMNALSAKAAKVIKKLPSADSLALAKEAAKADTLPWARNVFEMDNGKSAEIELKSNFIILELVDNRYQDGDKISVFKNGVKIISNLEMTNKVQSYRYEIGKNEKEVTLSFLAEDEGSIALATFTAVIKNGRENNLIRASLNKGETIKVIVKRK